MIINPARVWVAKASQKMTTKALAKAVGESPRTVARWSKPSGYSLELTDEQLQRLSFATSFPLGFFTDGDEETEFSEINDIGASLPPVDKLCGPAAKFAAMRGRT